MRKTYFYSDKSRKAKKNEKYFVLYALFPNIFLTFAPKRDKITPPHVPSENFTLTISKIKS